jgi:hypothetical protein
MSDNLSPVLLRFRSAAADFIQAVDSTSQMECEPFLARVSHCLAELYSSALHLPPVEPDTAVASDSPPVNDELTELFRSLKQKIGPLEEYWEIFDATAKEAPVQGSIALDISEIYLDLKKDLHHIEERASQRDFLWDLRFSFRSHWGPHLLAALKAIHDRHVE